MAFSMAFDKDSLSGGKVIPNGIYEVRLVGFKPRKNKNGDSVNFNAIMEVINHPDYDKTKLFETLSAKAGFTQWDFAHAFGLELEDQGNGQYALPGTWDGDLASFKADDPSTWKYDGPLVGRDAKVEVAIDTYEGKENNKIKRYFCIVPDCATRFPDNKHSQDLLKRK
jgi:hypothetical protein